MRMADTQQRPRGGRRRRRNRGLRRLALLLGILVVVAAVAYGVASRLRDSPPPQAAGTKSASPVPAASGGAGAPRPQFVADPQPVPILVYHHVLADQGGDKLLYVSPAEFESQLHYLKENGYEAVTMRQVYDAWTGKGSLPDHPVVISFDDGYVDQVRIAAPILRRFGWPAELAVVFNLLYKGDSPPDTVLTPAMVEELLADGWGLQSHSVSHSDLTYLSAEAVRHELEYSRKRLQQIFDRPVEFFCYPGGGYNPKVARAVRDAGYLAATSTDFAAATPDKLYRLPRIYCYRGESPDAFGERLRTTLAQAQDSSG
jgi:peptidoglycan/xylan/chitin deacetylase (PgdA/CDA1 family)